MDELDLEIAMDVAEQEAELRREMAELEFILSLDREEER